jgi:DNA-binding IclR family transcriptional regulator
MADRVQGAQVVTRVSAVLRALASRAPQGATTSEVALLAGLTRPTAHRLLSSLLREGQADRDNRTAQWFLGPEIYLMGMLAAPRFDVSEHALDSVRALAEARPTAHHEPLVVIRCPFPGRSISLAKRNWQ